MSISLAAITVDCDDAAVRRPLLVGGARSPAGGRPGPE